jgi:hypothetical protein
MKMTQQQMIDAARLAEVKAVTLASGGHDNEQNAFCVMEAVAYVAGEPWSDSPQCASPVIAAFLRSWNDSLSDEPRNRLLKPLIPLLVGTKASDEVEEKRSYMALDWLIRVFTPKWLELVPSLHEHAKALRDLEGIADIAGAAAAARAAAGDAAGAAARAAAGDAAWAAARAAARAAAWDAARAAAGDAAGDAARAAAGDAAGDAARAAARDAAWAAAWDAAWAAAGDAAGDAAGAAAGDAAGDAAWAAARAAAWAAAGDAARAAARAAAWAAAGDAARAAARAAAWAAAGAALNPTTEWLQASALSLIHRMIEVNS